jgi:protocatechuate 3,4-dioxygenase alpha subunit
MTQPPTPSQTVGPFFGFALPYAHDHELVSPEDPAAVRIEGQVLDGAGDPVPDALVELWHGELFGRCATDPEGAFRFVAKKPRRAEGAPHLNVTVFARGLLRHLSTRMYFPDEPEANARDEVLALIADPDRRSTLVARSENGVLRFDIRLQGDRETVFFAV